MDPHSAQVLGFDRIRTLLAAYADTPQGAALCAQLVPAREVRAARAALDEVAALQAIEPELGLPPTQGLQPVAGVLDAAVAEGACLAVEALLGVRQALEVCHAVLAYLEDAAAEGSGLGERAARMQPLYGLADRFGRVLGPRGEVLDGASDALREIRARARKLRSRILGTLETVLGDAEYRHAVQDDFVTLRSGRYVIPLRTDYSGYLDGIVHDRSRSGATFFVEPLAVVSLNNELGSLAEEEEEEIRRVLVGLTAEIGHSGAALRSNIAVVAELDFLKARLRLAAALRAWPPRLCAEPILDLRQVRHPLLDCQPGAEVVPIDLRLEGDCRLLLITGANAGGKTVALKTAGLCVLMAYSGLFLPVAEDSRVGWFSGLYADIGDEQDVEKHLSTFSAHVAHLRLILERAGTGCLVLLDELGTGTDPQEGVGLAMAVLESLADRGSVVLATTHLAGLKGFAYARSGAQNAAVAFDPATGAARYTLEYGIAGSSNALEVAARLGLPEPLVERARQYARGGAAADALITDLEEALAAARRAAREGRTAQRQLEGRIAEQERLLTAARAERDAARDEARTEVADLLAEARGRLRRVIAAFARRQVGQQAAERELEAVAEELRAALPALPPAPPGGGSGAALRVGDAVLVGSSSRPGVVEALEEATGRAAVRVGGVRVSVPRAELRPAGAPAAVPRPQPAAPVAAVSGAAASPGDLVVRGCRVDEALTLVEEALDRAVVAGASGFRVVHGRGTGALRRAVRERLAHEPHVREVRGERDGAATWVALE